MNTTIIFFDKQVITRLGLESVILKMYPRERSCNITAVSTKSDLVRMLVDNPESLVVIDYTLSDLNSVDTLLNISARFPGTHWILFSEELSVQFLKKVLCNEAFSVVLKHADLPEITQAISRALEGLTFVCSQVKEQLAMSENKGNQGENELLTMTEKEILKEIALGRSAKEIAASRSISMHTVVTHRKNIYRKLEVNNSQEAAGYALRAGILVAMDYCI
jgi:DNA-binding NarL/FixJ family response regulator